ncbi:MAG: cytochrome c4 [Gammaproteobacteria bacterium]|nr:cytochrome c4 [Gammaproteobacteria bacterium]
MNNLRRMIAAPAIAGVLGTLLGTAFLAAAPAAQAGGSAEAGQTKALVCTACHGPNGNSVNPEWPSLAGQNATYLVRTLNAFKSGERSNPLMTAQAMALTDEDIADIAAYYATQTPQHGTANPDLSADGERLYRGGNKETGISACIACHGPTGRGNAPAGYPALAGQHAPYSAAQLKAYRSGQRSSDLNQMMRNTTARLTDAEIDAVASFIQGLR